MAFFDEELGPTTPARIFLSHKSADKALVRDYKQTLELLGLKPWLDEDDLAAGAELTRGYGSALGSLSRASSANCARSSRRPRLASMNHSVAPDGGVDRRRE